jgi:Flp pilus assembly protein TadB
MTASPKHVEVQHSSIPATSQNQYEAPFAVSISFPEAVTIKMVDASALRDYELGLFLSSATFGVFVGFIVAYFQVPPTESGTIFLINAAIFGLIASAFFWWAMCKRKKMSARSRAFKLKTSGVEEVRESA